MAAMRGNPGLCRALARECRRLGRGWAPAPPADDSLWGHGGFWPNSLKLDKLLQAAAPACARQGLLGGGPDAEPFTDRLRGKLRRELQGGEAQLLGGGGADGAEVLEFLRWQGGLRSCTSTSEHLGLRVDAVSGLVEANSNAVKGQHLFAYNMRFTNTGQRLLRVLARQYDFHDGSGKLVQQIKSTQPEAAGVVGYTPCIKPGDVFEFGSGTVLNSPGGFVTGGFLVMYEPELVSATDLELHKKMEDAELVLRFEYLRSLETEQFHVPMGLLRFSADVPCMSLVPGMPRGRFK